MAIFALIFVELMTMRFAKFGDDMDAVKTLSHAVPKTASPRRSSQCPTDPYVSEHDQLSHSRDHQGLESPKQNSFSPESYGAQMVASFILEFGVIFHSIFVGLTLAMSRSNFTTLYVLIFHQTFEGLALGSRLASIDWPSARRWTPYLLGRGYALSTPAAMTIGLGARLCFNPASQTALVVNGIFDLISADILIYTGLVELMAHEFMFSGEMQRASA